MDTQQSPASVRPKIGKNVFSCATIAVACVILVLCAALFAVAKTGAVYLPVFSSFYTGPHPTRLVEAEPLSVEGFKAKIEKRFLDEAMSGKQPPYRVEVTEEELTGVMETAINAALRDKDWKRVYTQMVIRPTDLEFMSRFQQGIWHLNMLVRFRPVIENGSLSFEPTEVRIGDYPVPVSVAYDALGVVFSRDLGTFFLGFAGTRLQELQLQDGRLMIVATTR